MTAYVFKRKRPPVLQYTGDYTKVGSPTITDNVVSGFSASNYLITKSVFNPLDADFEFVFKINLTSHAVNVILAENRTGQFSKVYLCIGKDQKVFFGIGTGSAWRIRVYSNILLELNTDYWIKVVKNNGTFYIYYSLDGKDYILDNSVADTSVFPSITVEGRIGCWKDSSTGTSYFNGSIDLTESYIKLNGEYWWQGAEYVNADKAYVLKRKQYWKKVVTEITKYWKETTTETTELTYACYRFNSSFGWVYYYIKTPIGSSDAAYEPKYSNNVAIIPPSSSSDLTINPYHTASSLTENSCVIFNATYTRYTAGDLYETVTTTEIVPGTPDDYTYTEVETIESTVPATKDDYDFITDKCYVLRRK